MADHVLMEMLWPQQRIQTSAGQNTRQPSQPPSALQTVNCSLPSRVFVEFLHIVHIGQKKETGRDRSDVYADILETLQKTGQKTCLLCVFCTVPALAEQDSAAGEDDRTDYLLDSCSNRAQPNLHALASQGMTRLS